MATWNTHGRNRRKTEARDERNEPKTRTGERIKLGPRNTSNRAKESEDGGRWTRSWKERNEPV